jgi:hypothetical protein
LLPQVRWAHVMSCWYSLVFLILAHLGDCWNLWISWGWCLQWVAWIHASIWCHAAHTRKGDEVLLMFLANAQCQFADKMGSCQHSPGLWLGTLWGICILTGFRRCNSAQQTGFCQWSGACNVTDVHELLSSQLLLQTFDMSWNLL